MLLIEFTDLEYTRHYSTILLQFPLSLAQLFTTLNFWAV